MARPLADRFNEKWVPVPESGCWLWTASTTHGYGQLSRKHGRSMWRANRLSWILHRGEIPPGLDVCHKCDTRSCVNPDHLFLGTPAENMADMDRKGRRVNNQPKGVEHGMVKLTEEDVLAIRADTRPQRTIAREYGIHQGNVSAIKTGRIWKHLP